ncbi:DUF2291 family protein [Selenomonas sp. TAMA-11512]|uniref:DUF2291 family protein n=1 Tax=Selenomonas sp. TAMA-11512 TaxID=3095337 RepID=UPI00308DC652|nr:DUF2291 family protein [Selenomonas sp. TAMA-11512]
MKNMKNMMNKHLHDRLSPHSEKTSGLPASIGAASWGSMRKFLAAGCLAMSLVFTAGCVTVVPIGQEAAITGEKTFNAAEDVEAIWETNVVPELTEKAIPLSDLLRDANGNLKSQAAKGRYSMGDKGELTFIVKGEGEITAVDQTKKAGFMTVKLAGYEGPVAVKLQIGPVYKGSAIRDSLSFIKYEDYKNQVDWAKVSQAVHDAVGKDVIAKVDLASIQGKTVEFTGAFSVSGDKEVLVTPVLLTVK